MPLISTPSKRPARFVSKPFSTLAASLGRGTGAFCLSIAAAATLALTGCASPPLPPVVATISNDPQPFDQAIATATDGLLRQSRNVPGFVVKGSKRVVVLDPTLDAATGQQTNATQRLDRTIGERLARDGEQIEVTPFESANLSKAQYLVTGTLMRAQGVPKGVAGSYRLSLALVDVKAGAVVAQSSAVTLAEGVDMSPLAYYRDSPVLVRDKVIDGYVKTSTTPPGQPADATYLERIATATVINDATTLYNSARYREALGQYRSALATPAGDQIRVLNGIYLSNVRLGQTAEAEEAFGKLVAYGIAYNNLGVKFLFNPGSTEFWSDPKVTSAYAMWLRQIARQGARSKVCMDIVGHTSKTGPEAVNDTLSLKRAVYIRQRLNTESTEVASRTRPQGMGSRQTIVGTGTDDVVDAPDRRVEFSIVDCATR